MSKNLNMNLTFTAQTGQAKAQIQELQGLLNKIAYASTTSIKVDPTELRTAAAAAKELQHHLNKAYNSTTGNFDLSRLDKSLKSAGTNIGALSSQLLKAGDSGQQAFASLAQSIAKADQPMLRLGTRMNEFMTTLKNTFRWQISSSMLHGAMRTIQGAYGYAQDLNESLNNIRIVTGQSVEQMAAFADQANKAAKALSTTTTEYTNASLIYYQQGLNDQQVKERTDATIKMANVSRQSAEAVSDQMTAIWNNFDDGAKSLEYYGDVITALGAKTASSSQEIAAGLEKFAAVSETIGLSYEYATSALATVTATTRQSADVVGTAFKTIFSRLQGLQLGDSLEDGVTLNKYSEALAKVGVNAVDANGNLVEMDAILDQLGNRWQTLSEAEQTALAQTVAGVRQYTQLIALMDNWDFFKENLQSAYGAEGTLNEQAEIYAESWEAAADRVSAAAERIYQNLLDDKFFIGINNGLAEILGGIGEFVQGIGGMKGVIVAISSLLLTNFANRIPDAIKELSINFNYLTKGAGKAYQKLQKDFSDVSKGLFAKGGLFEGQQDSSFGFIVTSSNQIAAARTMAAQATKNLSNSEKLAIQTALDFAEAQQQEAYAAKQKAEALKETKAAQTEYFLDDKSVGIVDSYAIISNNVSKAMQDVLPKQATSEFGKDIQYAKEQMHELSMAYTKNIVGAFVKAQGQGGNISLAFTDLGESATKVLGDITELGKAINRLNDADRGEAFQSLKTELTGLVKAMPEGVREAFKLEGALQQISNASTGSQLKQGFDMLQDSLKNTSLDLTRLKHLMKGIYDPTEINMLINAFKEFTKTEEEAKQMADEVFNSLSKINFNHAVSGIEALSAGAALLGNISMGLNSIRNIFTTLSDPDISGFEKLTSVFMSLSMLAPAVMSGIKNFGTITQWASGPSKTLAAAITLEGVSLTGANKSLDAKTAKTIEQALAQAELNEEINDTIRLEIIQKALKKERSRGYDKNFNKSAQDILDEYNKQRNNKLTNLENLKKNFIKALPAIGKVAIAVGVAMAAIKLLDDAIYTSKERYEDISNASKGASENSEKIKSNFDEVKNSLDELDSGIKSIEELTAGTYEWEAAIRASNQSLIELLVSLGKLSDENYYIDENGLYHLKDGVQEEILKEQEDLANSADSFKILTNALTQQAKARQDLMDFAAKDDAANLFETHYMKIAEAYQDGLITSIEDFKDFDKMKQVMGDSNFSGDVFNDLYNLSDETASSILQLCESLIAMENQVQILGSEMVKTAPEFEEYLEKMTDADAEVFSSLMGKLLTDDVIQLYQKDYRDKWFGMTDKKAQDAFAAMFGYTAVNKKGNVADYKDANGEIVLQDLNDATARYWGAFTEAMAAAGTSIDSLQGLIETVKGLSGGSSLLSFLSGNGIGTLTLNSAQIEGSEELYNNTLLQKILQLDAAGIEAWVAQRNEIIENQQANTKERLSEILGEGTSLEGFNDLELNSLNNLAELFNKIDQTGGSNSGVKYAFNQLTNLLNATDDIEEKQKILDAFIQTDWSNWDALSNFKNLLEDLGITVNGIDWDSFASQMRAAGAATPISEFIKLKDTLNEILKIVNELDIGEAIDAEAFGKLPEEMQKYFSFANGEYYKTGTIPSNLINQDDYFNAIAESSDAYHLLTNRGITSEYISENADRFVSGTNMETFLSYLNSDAINALSTLTGYETDRIEDMGSWDQTTVDSFISALTQAIQQGDIGVYTNEQATTDLVSEAGSIGRAENVKGFYDEFGNVTKEAAEGLKVLASKNEEAYGALMKYNKAMEEAGDDTEAVQKATKQFIKELKQIEANAVGKTIAPLIDELKTLGEIGKENNYAQIAQELQKVFGDQVTSDFVKNNIDLVKQWTSGTDQVRSAAGQMIETLTNAEDAFNVNNEFAIKVDTSSIEGLIPLTSQIKAAIEANPITYKANGKADMSGLIQSLAAAGLTAEQVAILLASIGQTEIDFSAADFSGVPEWTGDPDNAVAWMEAFTAAMDALHLDVSNFDVPAGVAPEMATGGGGGGGGKAPERKRLSSDDRYKEINDKIDNLTETMKDYNRELDTAYGMGRVAAMDKILTKMEDEQDLLRDRIDLAKEYQDIDAKNLQKTMAGKTDVEYDSFADFGVADFTIDAETGDITNWTSVWTDFYSKRDAMMDELKGENGWEKAAIGARKTELEEQITKMDEFEEKVREDAEQYMETVEQREEWEQELKDKIIEAMEMRFDKWEASLDYMEEIQEHSLEQLERTLDYFSDSFFARAEKLVAMRGISNIYNMDDATALDEEYKKLTQLWTGNENNDGNPDITQEKYIEGLKHIEEHANNAIDELYSYMEDMTQYYKDTIDESVDILDSVIGQFDAIRSVLDHYSNIYKILEGENDYDTQLKVLEAQRDNLAAETKAWSNAYDMYSSEVKNKEGYFKTVSGEYEAILKEYREAQNSKKGVSQELQARFEAISFKYNEAKTSYEAIYNAAQQAQENMLASAEEYAQAIKDIYTTELEKFGKDLEKSALSTLEGVTSFDHLNDRIEQARSLTEDWLTSTNKIYETNKLINKAQSDLDKTTNQLAKKKLKGFMDETAQLQNQAKLSKFELEVQEAKYNLLLAEIALEEAQNAKSVVRMQKDSEGNYGYVYTADSEAIGEAEQNYLDAENELYNIRLEGANEFAEKKLELDQQYYDKLREIETDESLNEQERQQKRAELMNWYQQQCAEYARIFQVAIAEDARVAQDAWSMEFSEMVTDTESWKTNTNTYITAVKNAYTSFQKEIDRLNGLIGSSMGTAGKTIKDTLNAALLDAKNKTSELDEVIGDESNGLIGALNDEIDKVDEAAEHWRTVLLPELAQAIKYYKELAWNAGNDWITEAGNEPPPIVTDKPGDGGDDKPNDGGGDNLEAETNNGNKLTYTGPGNPEEDEESALGNNIQAGSNYKYIIYDPSGKVYAEAYYGSEQAAQGAAQGRLAEETLPSKPANFSWNIAGGYKDEYGNPVWKYRLISNGKIIKYSDLSYGTENAARQAAQAAYDAYTINKSLSSLGYTFKVVNLALLGGGGVNTVSPFDTGGYTGSWGPEGRLAMLHQKELVLNASDTENMLQAISLVRDIIQHIDLSAAVASTRGGFSLNALNDTTTALEQQVSIEANFPNVQDRYEIEAAFNNLINTASQFANRKKL